MIKSIQCMLIALLLTGCSADLSSYQATTPTFDIKQYFNGNVIAWGIVQDYTAAVQRRFCVEIIGTWEGNEGVLAETFYFSNGEVSYRNWHLIKLADGSYQGTAEDVVGVAIGKHRGFAFQFQYELMLSIDDSSYQVGMDDWMYLLDENRVMNKTSMSKFGIEVAEITIFFDKKTPNLSCR